MSDRTFNIIAVVVLGWFAFLFYLTLNDEPALQEGLAMRSGIHVFDKSGKNGDNSKKFHE